jgi:hypothetical protein
MTVAFFNRARPNLESAGISRSGYSMDSIEAEVPTSSERRMTARNFMITRSSKCMELGGNETRLHLETASVGALETETFSSLKSGSSPKRKR